MQINSVNTAGSENGVSGGAGGMDAYSKGIMKEIENIRQQMQELSQNDSMSMEEKMKKKQQMQQRINELNNELRKHQIEQRRQKQESGAPENDMLAEPAEKSSKEPSNGLSAGSMQAIISADASMEISRAGRRAASGLKATARVLESEIKTDAGRGNVEAKEKQLQKVEQRAEKATANQIKQLSGTVHDMREAARSEEDAEKEEQGEEQNAVAADADEEQFQALRKVDVLL